MEAQRRPNKYWATAIPGLGHRIFALVLASILVRSSTLATGVEIKPGNLDPTFGEGGKVTTDFFGESDGVSDIALQPNGKIVAVGVAGGDFALARYNRDGSLDTTFGDGGKVTTDFFGERDEARAIAIQPNGKIVVVGFARSNEQPDFALARYNRDGSLDESFGHRGKVTTDFFGEFDEAFDVALLPNGKIVVVGAARGSNTASVDFALTRYNRDGSLDTTFGDGGKVTTIFSSGDDTAGAVALQHDGKIVVAGVTNSGGPDIDFALARYNRDGSLDESFGDGGKVTTDFQGGAFAADVTLQPDGKIVAAGTAFSIGTSGDFALVRYNRDGSLDESFGHGGKVTTDFFGDSDAVSAIALQPDGKIIAVGFVFITNVGQDFALARYNRDGSLDESFGHGGRVTTEFFGDTAAATGVAIQRNGKIVAGGGAGSSNTDKFDFVLARYLSKKPKH
jgi:uncharacterized delta-60 repeat protein